MAGAVLRVTGLGGFCVAVVREEHELVRRTDRIFVRSCYGSGRDPSNHVSTDANSQTNGDKLTVLNKGYENTLVKVFHQLNYYISSERCCKNV